MSPRLSSLFPILNRNDPIRLVTNPTKHITVISSAIRDRSKKRMNAMSHSSGALGERSAARICLYRGRNARQTKTSASPESTLASSLAAHRGKYESTVSTTGRMLTIRPSALKRRRIAGSFFAFKFSDGLLHFRYTLPYCVLLILGKSGGHKDIVEHIYLGIHDQP